jgi:hypothetical protein
LNENSYRLKGKIEAEERISNELKFNFREADHTCEELTAPKRNSELELVGIA